jgi:hypothetical protein
MLDKLKESQAQLQSGAPPYDVIPQIKKEPETYDPDGLIVIGD